MMSRNPQGKTCNSGREPSPFHAHMKFAVVAQRSTPTNLALASCVVPGVESLLLTPAQAVTRLEPGDIALGRLDVLHSLDGVEPGTWAFDALAGSGCRLLNRPGSVP